MNKKISDSQRRIKLLCSHFGITQKELAEKVNISEATISNYANGKKIPHQNSINKIADTFKVSAEWLMGYGEDNDIYNTSSSNTKLIEAYNRADQEIKDIVNNLLNL